MDKTTQERLVGAVILVGLVVLIVPALLTGPREPAVDPSGPSAATRSVEIDLRPATKDPEPVAALDEPEPQPRTPTAPAPKPEPEPEPARPAAPAAAAPPRDQPVEAPAPPAAEQPAATAGVWAVQVAALSRRDAAERLVADLKKAGYRAFLLEYRSDGRVLYRVRVGPEQERTRVDGLAARLRQDGYQAAVVAHP